MQTDLEEKSDGLNSPRWQKENKSVFVRTRPLEHTEWQAQDAKCVGLSQILRAFITGGWNA